MRSRLEAYLAGEFTIPANDAFGFAVRPDDDPKQGVSVSWQVTQEFCNSAGNLQGGILAAFADSALGAACAALIPARLFMQRHECSSPANVCCSSKPTSPTTPATCSPK
jgi:acyl-coenzyme A thioesterase PaaI-like protein